MPLYRIFSRPLSNVLFQGLGFGSSKGAPAPPPYPLLIWEDDFESYADTAAMLAGEWSAPFGDIALDAGRLRLLSTDATAHAARAIPGVEIGDRIRITYDVKVFGFSAVELRNAANSVTLASGTISVGEGRTLDYTAVDTDSYTLRFRRNQSSEEPFADNIIVENLGPL